MEILIVIVPICFIFYNILLCHLLPMLVDDCLLESCFVGFTYKVSLHFISIGYICQICLMFQKIHLCSLAKNFCWSFRPSSVHIFHESIWFVDYCVTDLLTFADIRIIVFAIHQKRFSF